MPSPYDRNIRSAADVVEATTDCPKNKQKLYEACRDIKYQTMLVLDNVIIITNV